MLKIVPIAGYECKHEKIDAASEQFLELLKVIREASRIFIFVFLLNTEG
jgi:hypothetical protein